MSVHQTTTGWVVRWREYDWLPEVFGPAPNRARRFRPEDERAARAFDSKIKEIKTRMRRDGQVTVLDGKQFDEQHPQALDHIESYLKRYLEFVHPGLEFQIEMPDSYQTGIPTTNDSIKWRGINRKVLAERRKEEDKILAELRRRHPEAWISDDELDDDAIQVAWKAEPELRARLIKSFDYSDECGSVAEIMAEIEKATSQVDDKAT